MTRTRPRPRPDPLPSPPQSLVQRFWRIFRLLLVFAVVVAAIAVAMVARGDDQLHLNMLIATALGTGFTVLVGAGLMTLVFLSASSGHDEAAGRKPDEGDGQR
ncbi:MAG: hypothetical protein QFB89_07990 [Pseudomonadota bacterium]|nr:hypothetical protein [Pseudomonadota bacterium]